MMAGFGENLSTGGEPSTAFPFSRLREKVPEGRMRVSLRGDNYVSLSSPLETSSGKIITNFHQHPHPACRPPSPASGRRGNCEGVWT